MKQECDISMLLKLFFQINPGIDDSIIEPEELDTRIEQFDKLISGGALNALNISANRQTVLRAIEEIRSRVSVKFTLGTTLSDGIQERWVAECWSSNPQYYWKRYKECLKEKDWSSKVIRDIDTVTDDILDQCGNPQISVCPWQRRGLVIGDVQSGKTAVFTGLINKAADAGYRIIIVLTGMLETLRRQTQGRLDAEFVGKPSGNYAEKHEGKAIGVGLIDSKHIPVSCTSVDADFNKKLRGTLNFPLASANEPLLLVLKKNRSVLVSVNKWLKDKNLDGQYINRPLLLIDDEADNASVNTNKEDQDPTKINEQIRILLALFKNATYIGFTATPFANVFINPDVDVSGDTPDDLFPRNFIRTTNIPSNYFGVPEMLSDTDFDEEVSYEKSPYLCRINDAEHDLPLKHKKDFKLKCLWPSIKTSIQQYLLINTILDLRKLDAVRHRSMMINVSRFTQIQNDLSDLVADYVDEIRDNVEVYGSSASADRNPIIRELRDTYTSSFPNSEFSWNEVLAALYESNKLVKVYVVNTSNYSKQNKLDYEGNRYGIRAVVIGGLAIARGVTLEGLCVSYLYRSTAYYDTLMQMGRWFGYRPGYQDLCRIWLSETTADYYRQIARATAELKVEVGRMKDAGMSPRDFGLKVRDSPDALLITSRNKMRSGKPVVLRTSFSSYFVETVQLRRVDNDGNIKAVREFVSTLKKAGCAENEMAFKKRLIFRNVPKEFVADFVEHFEVHPRCYQLAPSVGGERGMSDFIRNTQNSKLKTWDVVFEQRSTGESGKDDLIDFGLSKPLHCIRRCVSDLQSWEKGNLFFDRNRIAGSDVEAAPLPVEVFNRLKNSREPCAGDETGAAGLRLKFRNERQSPLIVIMPVRVYEQTEKREERFKKEKLLDSKPYVAYALSFCNFSGRIENDDDKVLYKVNKTWIHEHLDTEDESEEDEE